MKGVSISRAFNSVIITWLVICGFVIMEWEVKMARGQLSAAACKEERRVGINACKAVIYGQNPTPECCVRVRVSHVECVCPVVTPVLAALIDVNRAIRLIQGCGRRVPRNFHCGSVTTP